MNIILKDKTVEVAENHLTNLKAKTFEELLKLYDYQQSQKVCGDKKKNLVVWKDQIDSEKIRIVVQINKSIFLGFRNMFLEGFTMDRNGKINDLTQEELLDLDF